MIPEASLIAIVEHAARDQGVDMNLARAIVFVESSWDPRVSRFEKNWKYLLRVEEFAKASNITEDTERTLQSMSIGLMQIMGTVARELGFRGNLSELYDPALNAKYGCMKLAELSKKHSEEADVISSYNQGSPRKTEGGMYRNQAYVDKVSQELRRLRGLLYL